MQYVKRFICKKLVVPLMICIPGIVMGQQNVKGDSSVIQQSVTAFDGYIEGSIVNEKMEPMQGVVVKIEGTQKGVLTNAKGTFRIRAEENNVLVISHIGYESQQVTVTKNMALPLAITLKAVSKAMDEVVVVGVQAQTKKTTISSLAGVSGRDIENMPSPSLDAMLQGRVAGLNVQLGSGEPGVAPTMVIRGNAMLNKSIDDPNVAQAQAMSSPLYVIDGVPFNTSDISNVDNTGTNFLAGINVNDIENVVVQKDASATAAWGSLGANGVIYITTKKGRARKPEFRVNAYGGASMAPPLLPTYTGAQERRMKLDLINQYNPTAAQWALVPTMLTDSLNPYFNNATNWQDLFYRNGNVKNIDGTVSAATENVNYRVSFNYYDEKGVIQAFGYTRYGVNGNFNFKLSPKLSTQFLVRLSRGDRQRGMKYYDNSDAATPVDGTNMPASFYLLNGYDSLNFMGRYNNLRNKNINDDYAASFTLNYQVLHDLKYTLLASASTSMSNRDYFQPSNINQVAVNNGASATPSKVESDKGAISNYFITNTLNYSKQIATSGGHTHQFTITGTQNFKVDVINSNKAGGTNTPTNQIEVVSGVPQSYLFASSDYQRAGLLSFAGQAQYNFDTKYLLYASYRGDASSRFGNKSKWGYFPALGAGWVLSDEKFMKAIHDYVNFFKIRASWGLSGTNSPYFYAPYNSYTIPGSYGGSLAVQPSYTNGLTKDNLTWAKSTQKNIGADIELFNSRVMLTVDAYDKVSSSDYYTFNLPFYVGYQSVQFNAKDLWIDNRGLEVTLGAQVLPRTSKFGWHSQVNFAFNKNVIAKLPNNNRTFVISDGYGVGRIFSVGQPVYEMFQIQYAGVYNRASDIPFNKLTGQPITYYKGNHTVVPGDPIWVDVNHIGDVWSGEDNGNQYGDRVPSGNPNPKVTGGWVNDFTYKNFSLSILSVFTWKREIVNIFRQSQFDNFGGSINNFAYKRLPDISGLNYWTPQKAADPNFKADFPSLLPFGGYYYQFFPFTTMWNEDGSYFKIKTIRLNYLLPTRITTKFGLKGASIYGVADNVLTIKNSTMADPELVDNLGVYYGGAYPAPRKITFGIDVQF